MPSTRFSRQQVFEDEELSNLYRETFGKDIPNEDPNGFKNYAKLILNLDNPDFVSRAIDLLDRRKAAQAAESQRLRSGRGVAATILSGRGGGDQFVSNIGRTGASRRGQIRQLLDQLEKGTFGGALGGRGVLG